MSYCKYNIDDCRHLAFTKKGKCLSSEYVGSKKLEWECEFGHRWLAKFHHVKSGTWCSVCHKQKLKKGYTRLSIEQIKERLSNLGFKFLDNTYTNSLQKYNLECPKGHIFNDKTLRHILYGVVGCSFCNNYFNSERKFRDIIERIFKKPFPKCRPKWLVNPETGYSLELDCYNEQLKLAFEYDGQFHFEIRKGLNNNLERTKKLDKLKDEICLKHGITLIRIPYFLKDKELYNKIIEGFKAVYGVDYWLILRELDNGTPCPAEIKIARQEARNRIVR